MRLNKLISAAAVASLVATPVLAANPAAKLSVAPTAARAHSKAGKSELAGGGFVIAAIAAAAVIAGVLIISNDSDSN